MKKNYYFINTAVCLVFLLLINSCRKDVFDLQPQIPLTLIEQSKIHFEENVQSKKVEQGITTSGQRFTRKNSTKVPLWKEAYVRKISIGEAVIVPIHYSNTMYIKKGKEKQAVSLDNLTYLMIYKNKQNEMVTEVVQQLPDDEYWDYPKRNLKPFQGVIAIEDWQGNFIKAYQYLKGGEIVKVNPVSNVTQKKKENKTSAVYWSFCFQYVNNCTCSDKSNCDWCPECTQTDCYSGWTEDGGGGGDGGGTTPGDYSGGGGGSGGGGTTNPCGGSTGVNTSAAPCNGDDPSSYPGNDPVYVFTNADHAILDEITQEDDIADAALLASTPCYGTGRNGNVRWPGTAEHWLIQYDYVNNFPGSLREYSIPGSSINGNRGFADLVNTFTNEIFEIKPGTSTGQNNGELEVQNYVEKANQSCPSGNGAPWVKGANYVPRYLPHPTNPGQVLYSQLTSAGVIGYNSIDKVTSPEPIPVVLPQGLADKLKNFVQQLLENPINMQVRIIAFLRQNPEIVPYLKAASAAIVIGTIIEDVLTGGAGIADDWASFLIARNIWRIASKM